MEDIENAMPYYQTGIRGDPEFKIKYENHPFDLLREARERGDGECVLIVGG